jgi:hypothetical protein
LRYVSVSPKSGLPVLERSGSISDHPPLVLTDAEPGEQALILRRVFEPVRLSHDEQVTAND